MIITENAGMKLKEFVLRNNARGIRVYVAGMG